MYIPDYKRGENINQLFATIRAPVMQFTGLRDKNGKDIYEGDILGGENYKNLKVYWAAPTFGVVDVKDSFDWSSSIPTYLEIIGNIYENSNLLS